MKIITVKNECQISNIQSIVYSRSVIIIIIIIIIINPSGCCLLRRVALEQSAEKMDFSADCSKAISLKWIFFCQPFQGHSPKMDFSADCSKVFPLKRIFLLTVPRRFP